MWHCIQRAVDHCLIMQHRPCMVPAILMTYLYHLRVSVVGQLPTTFARTKRVNNPARSASIKLAYDSRQHFRIMKFNTLIDTNTNTNTHILTHWVQFKNIQRTYMDRICNHVIFLFKKTVSLEYFTIAEAQAHIIYS